MSVSPPPGSAAVIDIASSDSDEEQQQSRKFARVDSPKSEVRAKIEELSDARDQAKLF